jgi:uncharacterized protein YxeA
MKKTVALAVAVMCFSICGKLQVSNTVSLVKFKPYTYLKGNYTFMHYGFICKKEWQLQKTTNVNLFFRLGSKDYVDYLEQKQVVTNKYLLR